MNQVLDSIPDNKAMATERVSEGRSIKEIRATNILVLTDAFLPHAGGSRVYYYTLYKELVQKYPDRITILTKKVPGWEDFDSRHSSSSMRIVRRFRPLPNWNYEQLPKFFPDLVQAWWFARNKQADIIHSGDLFPQGLVSMMLKKLLRIPFVAYCHGEEVTQIDYRRIQPEMRDLVYRSADAVVAANGFARANLVRIGVREDRIFTITPGVDTSRFTPTAADPALVSKYGLSGKVVLLSVSRLVERKGHSHLLRALAVLRDFVPEFHYLIVGDGPEREKIKTLIAELGLEQNVSMIGKVTDRDLIDHYNLCDIFMLANRDIKGDLEGFGMVFLEANACGKAVLGGRTGGTSEAVLENSTGLLVDPENIDEIASGLRTLISQRALRMQFAANGLQRVRTEFFWPTRAEQLRAVNDFVLRAKI
jgi:phosphatidylinositol alpha-1,6-mannosyltransferase